MTDVVVQGLLAGYGVAIPVGAIAALIVSLTARTSLAVGSAAALGVATADGIYALLAALGGAALAHVIQPVSGPLRWVAMFLLLVIAARSALAAIRHYTLGRGDRAAGPDDARPGGRGPGSTGETNGEPLGRTERAGLSTPPRAYAGLLGLTMLNPMTIVYFGALVLGRGDRAALTAGRAAIFVVAAFAASASWQLLLAGGGALIGRLLTGPRGRLVTALSASAVIVVLAVALVI